MCVLVARRVPHWRRCYSLVLSHSAGENVRKLIKDGFVIRKPAIIHSRSRVNKRNEAKAKGRHTGASLRLGLLVVVGCSGGGVSGPRA